MTDQSADGGHEFEFKLTSNKSTYYKGERFSLHLTGPQPDLQRSGDGACPTLYLRERSPNGQTRIDEIQPLAFNGCPGAVRGREPGNWQRGFELESGANSRWEGTGKHELQIFLLASSPEEPQLRFRPSNILQIQIADPAAIVREWGPHVKGIAADVTLDKATFRLGEDIPLHLAIEDFDAKVPLYSWDPLWDPCLAISIEVQDERGHALSLDRRFPASSICTGHGFGPRPVAKNTVIPMERTLRTVGGLPNHEGTFTVVVTWTPCFSTNNEGSTVDRNLKPYAVAQASSIVRIVSVDVLGPTKN